MFTLKQFSVSQENTAMKVCTDSCLFGAIVHSENPASALDIGTGTGLLSLMLAQKYPNLFIDAVEIDQNALIDAEKNILESPFKERISLIHSAIQAYNTDKKYDLIVSNPPFYVNQLKSPKLSTNYARHSEAINNNELMNAINKLLKPTGSLWLMLPPTQMQSIEKEASKYSLYSQARYFIKPNLAKPVFRVITEYKFTLPKNVYEQEILIYENNNYSPIFAQFLRDYYLIF